MEKVNTQPKSRRKQATVELIEQTLFVMREVVEVRSLVTTEQYEELKAAAGDLFDVVMRIRSSSEDMTDEVLREFGKSATVPNLEKRGDV